MAIRALNADSLSDTGALPNLQASEAQWANNPQPSIRAAAALGLGSKLTPAEQVLLRKLSQDPDRAVRRAVARGLDLAQNSRDVPLLVALLNDPSLEVREAAASSLASLPVAQTRSVLQQNVANPEFKSIFVVVLAEDNPTPYLGDLAEIVKNQSTPPQFCGNLPDYEAWDILFTFISRQPQASLTLGKARFLDVLETATGWESSAPTELYTFYVSHGMKDRALRFRQASKKSSSFDMEAAFNQIDAETPVLPQ